MNRLLKTLNKYIIILIIWSFFGTIWTYIFPLFFRNNILNSTGADFYTHIISLPTYISHLIHIIVTILLVVDLKKENLSNIILISLATLFYPLLGIVILSLLLLEKWKDKAGA